MSEDSNKKDKKSGLNKVEEPITEYLKNKVADDSELHPILIKLIEKSKQDLKEGKGIPHEVVMRNLKEKYPFLK